MDKEEIIRLFEQIKNFDQAAFTKFIKLTQNELIKLSFLYLHDKMLAEDIVNDTYISLINNLKNFKHTENIYGWLKVVTINKSLNLIKKRNREKSVEDNILYSKIDNKAKAENHTDKIMVHDCLLKLKKDERFVLLCHSYGFTLNEISKETNFSIKKVRTLLAKAKKNFILLYEN